MAAKKKNRTAETEHNPSPTPAVTESEMNVLNLPSPILYCTPDSVNNKSFSISRGTKYCVIQEDTVEDTKETFEGEDSTSVNGMKKQISEHQIDRYSRSSRSDVDGNIQSLDMGSTLQTLSTDAPSQDKLEQNTEDSKGHHQLKDPDRKVNDFVSVKRHNQSIDAPSQESELDKTNVWELKLKKAWAFNTRKCVDASPLVVVRGLVSYVYIGSHSHVFCCVDLLTGRCVWQTILPDQIESSACSSQCGRYVIVGCYDHTVYVLCAGSGRTVWRYMTHGAVRCTPCTDPGTGLVLCGSGDGSLYALSVQQQRCVWQTDLHSLSIVTSPCVSASLHHVYTATLGGDLVALDADSGEEIWRRNLGRPLFSSPMLIEAGVCVGCVDGYLYCVSHRGDKLWQYKAGAEIFSSPALSFVPRLSAENANPSKILQQTNEILQLSTEKSRRPIETPQYSSEAPQCLSKIPQYPSETPQYTSETPKDPSETPQCLSETPRFSLDHSTPDIIEKPQEKEKLSTFRHPVLVIGSQDNGSDQHYIHCLDMQGQLLWKYAMGSRVYSTCFYFEISEERWEKKFQIVREELQRETESQRRTTESLHQAVESQKEVTESRRKATESCGKVFEQTDSKRSNSQSIETCRTKDRILREQNQATSSKKSRGFVVACSTKGELCVLDAVTGTLCSQYTFPYEVFSSPVVHDGRIVVGCRDDFVYCLDMEWELK